MLEVDFHSWRRKNLSRPLQELVREAIQNILDENPTSFSLDIQEVSQLPRVQDPRYSCLSP